MHPNVSTEGLLTHKTPDGKPNPGDGRQFQHEVDVDQHGRRRYKGHTGCHVGQAFGVLRLLQDDDNKQGEYEYKDD